MRKGPNLSRREFLALSAALLATCAIDRKQAFAMKDYFGEGDDRIDPFGAANKAWEAEAENDSLPEGESATAPAIPERDDQPERRYYEGTLNLYNTHTREYGTFHFRDKKGRYNLKTFDQLNWFLRCHATNEYQRMDYRVIEILNCIDKLTGGNRWIYIVSAYRTPAYNAQLCRTQHNVARNSLHMYGMALDFHIPGVPQSHIRTAALYVQQWYKFGGVGIYPTFTHIDTGRARRWQA